MKHDEKGAHVVSIQIVLVAKFCYTLYIWQTMLDYKQSMRECWNDTK